VVDRPERSIARTRHFFLLAKMNIRKPVPLWVLLLTILVSGIIIALFVYFPRPSAPPGPDFNLTLSSNPVLIQATQSNTTTVTIESVRGFVGVVSFGVVSPSGITAQLSDSQLVLGSSGSLSLRTWGTTPADYSVRIVATGGQASHYVDLVVRVLDLTVTTNTTSLTVARGSSGTIAITLKSLNGLSGNITLGSSVCHPQSFGCPVDTYLTSQLAPSSLILQAGGSATIILTVTVSNSDSPTTDSITIRVNRGPWGFYTPSVQLTIV
jgi:hypothetical protein